MYRGVTGCLETRKMIAEAISEGEHKEGDEVDERTMLLLLLLPPPPPPPPLGIWASMAIIPTPSAEAQPKSASGSCCSAERGTHAPLRAHRIVTLMCVNGRVGVGGEERRDNGREAEVGLRQSTSTAGPAAMHMRLRQYS